MEMFRNAVYHTALSLLPLVAWTCCVVPAIAQEGDTQLTSTNGAANHTITQAVERMQMLVKSSSILKLEAKIPRFQVHNEEVLGATPISQNELQVFAKTPGTTKINLWDTEDRPYEVEITVIADAREIEGILSSQLPLATLKVMPVNASAIVSGYVTSVDDVDRAIAIVETHGVADQLAGRNVLGAGLLDGGGQVRRRRLRPGDAQQAAVAVIDHVELAVRVFAKG